MSLLFHLPDWATQTRRISSGECARLCPYRTSNFFSSLSLAPAAGNTWIGTSCFNAVKKSPRSKPEAGGQAVSCSPSLLRNRRTLRQETKRNATAELHKRDRPTTQPGTPARQALLLPSRS